MQYKDLNHALRKFRGQVSESIPYCIENFPSLSSPEKIFKYLKPRVTYKKDPPGRELFQTTQTLFENNRHGIPGAGDCDCFTNTALAMLIANGFTDCGIVLAGRNPFTAKHIYVYVNDKGKRKVFDLTNGSFDYERYYPYKQSVPYNLNQNEKDMILELADGPGGGQYGQPGYIYFPSKGVQVREDYFDGMSTGKFQNMCLEEGIEVTELEELSGRRADRKARRQSGELSPRQQRKLKKQAAKPRNIRKGIKAEAKADKTRSAGKAKLIRARAKVVKAQSSPAPPPPQDNYEQPGYYQEPEEEQEIIYEEEPTEQEVYEAEMEERFMGETSVGGMTVSKGLLWGIGLTIAGAAVGYSLKKRKRRRMAA